MTSTIDTTENNEPLSSIGGRSLVRKFVRAGLYKSERVLQFIILNWDHKIGVSRFDWSR